MIFFCCLNKKIKDRLIFKNNAIEIIKGYSDIINIINFDQQLETLQLILLTEKEMSLFNKIYKNSFNSKLREDLFKVFQINISIDEMKKIKDNKRKAKKILNLMKFFS